jgi:hypothetical protein
MHMTKKNSDSLSYLKFLHLVEAIRGLSDFPALDAVEDRLLNLFAANWHRGKKLTVLEAMAISPDISPTTVHRRLKTLRQKELITLGYDPVDSRIKYIEPTDKANQYFTHLGQCLSQAANKA